MNLSSVIFIDSLPKLDLHGYDRETAVVAIKDFIRDNIKLKNDKFVIIHGIGSGILKSTTHNVLKKDKHVIEYMITYNNVGSTIVHVKI